MKQTILSLVMAVLCAVPAFGTTIHVPAYYSTIQAGIDNAVDGDTVLIADGTYTGDGNRDIDFLGKAIVVRSENGPEVTVVDCEGSIENRHRGFLFHNGEGLESKLEGFTIQNGYVNFGGGIYCSSSVAPTITNCIISGNTASDYGGGIYCRDSSPTITNCTIEGNTADYHGAGIFFHSSAPMITNCIIAGNTCDDDGGGIFCDSSTPMIMNCTISENTAINGSGIWCRDSSPTITNCTISGNTAGVSGGGVYCCSSDPAITNCILWDDSPEEIYVSSGNAVITYSDIEGGYTGVGNIDADPMFLDPGNDDFHLQNYSPCIDRGTDEGAPSQDYEGDDRWDHPSALTQKFFPVYWQFKMPRG